MNQSDLVKEQTRLTRAEEQKVWEMLDIEQSKLAISSLVADAQFMQADASTIKAKVEEMMRPLELEQRKWEMWVKGS